MRCYGDKPASFFKLQPNGAIPVAIIDDQVYNQSNDILQILERKFTPEMPDGSNHMALSPPPTNKILQNQAQQLYRLERELFSAWMGWLTAGYGKQNFVDILRTVDDVLQRADGPFFLGSHGLSLGTFANNGDSFTYVYVVRAMKAATANIILLTVCCFSVSFVLFLNYIPLVDIQFAPFLERMVASCTYQKQYTGINPA